MTLHNTAVEIAKAFGVMGAGFLVANGALAVPVCRLVPHAMRSAAVAGPPAVAARYGLVDVLTAANAGHVLGAEVATAVAAVIWLELGKDNDQIRAAEIRRHGQNADELKAKRKHDLWVSAGAQAATQSTEEEARTFRAVVLALAPSRANIQGGGGGGDVNVAVAG